MTYDEIVKEMEENGRIDCGTLTGEQCFMLMRDGYVKYIDMDKSLYECNIIPYNDFKVDYIYISKSTCPNILSALDTFKKIIKKFNLEEPAYVVIEDEIFQVVIDILETET